MVPRDKRRAMGWLLACIVVIWLLVQRLGLFDPSHETIRVAAGHIHDGLEDAEGPFGPREVPLALQPVYNSSLGFEKVFVINLPHRGDKLDVFTLASWHTKFKADRIEGVIGRDVPLKTLPLLDRLPREYSAERINNTIGCWRAHLNVARRYVQPTRVLADGRIVEQDLQSALIMEDDADWDIHLKDQLFYFAQGALHIQAQDGVLARGPRRQSARPSSSPYGDDWDVLWLGHCGSMVESGSPPSLLLEHDRTTVGPKDRVNFMLGGVPDLTREGIPADDHSRIVYSASGGLCLYAYALSARGARRLLHHQTRIQHLEPMDDELSHLCSHADDFRCISTFPQIIDSHRPVGRVSRDSDIEPRTPDGKISNDVRTTPYTFNIMYSVRINLDKLIRNLPIDQSWRQWPNTEMVDGAPRTHKFFRH